MVHGDEVCLWVGGMGRVHMKDEAAKPRHPLPSILAVPPDVWRGPAYHRPDHHAGAPGRVWQAKADRAGRLSPSPSSLSCLTVETLLNPEKAATR